MRVSYNNYDGRAVLRGYVQFNKYTHTHTLTIIDPPLGEVKVTSIHVRAGVRGYVQLNKYTHFTILSVLYLFEFSVTLSVNVCVLSSHLLWTSDLWTHQSGSHRISPPSFCGACLIFYREKDSAVPFPHRP